MLRHIGSWCRTAAQPCTRPEIPLSILRVLLEEEHGSLEGFVEAVKVRIDDTPKYLDIDFCPPVFPFDNKYFEDPLYLVEPSSYEHIDLQCVKSLDEEGLENYLRQIHERFTDSSQGPVRVKRKELLNYAGRNFYFEALRAREEKKGPSPLPSPRQRQKGFLTRRCTGMNSLHPCRTLERSILRRKAISKSKTMEQDLLIAREDLVEYKRKSQERTLIMVAIDCSKSMEQGGKLAHAKKAALSFHYYQSSRGPQDRLDFVAFNNTVRKVNPLDILCLQPEGMTHTAELLNFVFHYFKQAGKHRGELYVITDGYPQQAGMQDSLYHAVTLKIARRLAALDIQVKIILIDPSWSEMSPGNLEYNRLICTMLKGELVRVDPEDISGMLID